MIEIILRERYAIRFRDRKFVADPSLSRFNAVTLRDLKHYTVLVKPVALELDHPLFASWRQIYQLLNASESLREIREKICDDLPLETPCLHSLSHDNQ